MMEEIRKGEIAKDEITKIFVIADTSLPDEVIPTWLSHLVEPFDYVIHAGDFQTKGAYETMNAWINKKGKKKLLAVWGNMDNFKAYGLKGYKEIRKGGIKIGLVHNPFNAEVWKPENLPQNYPQAKIDRVKENLSAPDFKTGFENLTNIAQALDVQVLVFGHIHHPMIANGDRLLICPGRSTSFAEARNSPVTYACMTIENGTVDAKIKSMTINFLECPSDQTSCRRLKANH